MPKLAYNIINQKFGKLTVLTQERLFKNQQYKTWCYCKCDCGKFKLVCFGHLISSKIRSCGCLYKRIAYKKLSYGEAARNHVIHRYKYQAKRRGLIWSLTLEQLIALFNGNCYYCGIEPNNFSSNLNKKKFYGGFIYNGIDRVDNSKGYEIENVVTCCRRCNECKKASTKEDFLKWVGNIAERHL